MSTTRKEYTALKPFEFVKVNFFSVILHSHTHEETKQLMYSPTIMLEVESHDEVHMLTLLTDISEISSRLATYKAYNAAKVYSENYIHEIELYDENGDQQPLKFGLKDIVQSDMGLYTPLGPGDIAWPKFFSISVNASTDEDGVQMYNPSISIVAEGVKDEEHAITIVTSIMVSDLDKAIKLTVEMCMKLATAYKDDILIITHKDKLQAKLHYRTVTEYIEELTTDFSTLEKPAYLH